MKRSSVLLLFVCLLAAAPVGSVSAEEALAGEVRNLSRAVERLAGLLEAQAKAKDQELVLRRLDLAIGYIDFRSRRIESLERDVLAARDAKDRIEDLFKQWGEREKHLEQTPRNNLRSAPGELEQARDVAGFQRRLLEERMLKIDSTIVVLENRIAGLKKQIDGVESFVQRNLDW